MIELPSRFQDTISDFSSAFRKDVYKKFEILLSGAILCPGSRTVCNLLRIVGLHWEKNFSKYHRFLNRDKWSPLLLAGVLLGLLIEAFVPLGEALVFGLDDTIERRWGKKIKKRAIYRDPVRSSKSHFVKCSGLRWLSLMLLTPLPWLEKGIYWALPVLTALCPSERFYTKQGKSAKKLTISAAQIISWLSRQCAKLNRPVFVTGDGSFATIKLFMHCQECQVGMIARMKLNSRLYDLPPKEYPKNKRGPKPPVGKRIQSMEERLEDENTVWESVVFSEWYGNRDKEMLITSGVSIWRIKNTELVKIKWVLLKDPEGKLEPTLLGCTDFTADPKDIVRYFVRRWRVEVTFAEVRRHLGVETQRQWSDLAIERTTPCLMATFSIVCLFANVLHQKEKITPNHTAWYKKKGVTFSDVLAAVRLEIFQSTQLLTSPQNSHIDSYQESIKSLLFILTQAVA